MNSGIQEAHGLAWRLALVTRHRASPSLLDAYSTERLQVARGLMTASNNQTRLATVRPKWGTAARDLFLTLATKSGRLERKLAPTLTQLAIDYQPHTRTWRKKHDRNGQRIPNVLLTRGSTSQRLFSLLTPHLFSVVALDCAHRVIVTTWIAAS